MPPFARKTHGRGWTAHFGCSRLYEIEPWKSIFTLCLLRRARLRFLALALSTRTGLMTSPVTKLMHSPAGPDDRFAPFQEDRWKLTDWVERPAVETLRYMLTSTSIQRNSRVNFEG